MSRIVGLVLVGALGAAACGGSSDTTDPSDATGASNDPGETPASTSAPPSADAGSPGAAGPVGDFCKLNDELGRLFGELASRTGDDAEATWLNVEIVVGWIQEEAPEELTDDVAKGSEYYASLGEALRAADFDNPVAVVEAHPQSAEMEQIEARVDDYLDANC